MTKNSGPGYQQTPEHEISIRSSDEQRQIYWQGEVIASSSKVLVLHENNYPPVFYFPRQDVKMDFLKKTHQKSYCPFKGYACYWTIHNNGSSVRNVAWSYEKPYDEVGQIKNHIAFYESKLTEGKE